MHKLSFFVFLLLPFIYVSCGDDDLGVEINPPEEEETIIYGSIAGIIKDADDGHLIKNCEVSMDDTDVSVVSDENGKFVFPKIIPGVHTISFSKPGYAVSSQNVRVLEDNTLQVTALMRWDGKEATMFAEGKGTAQSPYVIETGGQLMLVSQGVRDEYYVLNNDIDLGNISWEPFELLGNLDGNGFTIKNLNINSSNHYHGLFSITKGSIQNLTIEGVKIDVGKEGYVGSLVGDCQGAISNCNVILTPKSYITGGDYTGGLVGSCSRDITNCHVTLGSDSKITGGSYTGGLVGYAGIIQDCTVSSDLNNSSIKGNVSVGGLCGVSYSVKDCHSVANVQGIEDVGGIVGSTYGNIFNSSAAGHIEGNTNIGGVVGTISGSVARCKSDVSLTVNDGIGAGISGHNGYIVCCYSKGTINASGNSTICGIAGGYNDWLDVFVSVSHCYSTMTSNTIGISGLVDCAPHVGWYSYYRLDHSAYVGNLVSDDETNKSYCTNITSFFRSFNISDYDQYWNYNNTWTWEGTIEGKNVKVSCPKLAWEK